MINLLADRHIDHLKDYLHPEVDCSTFNPETGPDNALLKTADALLVRSVTRVDKHLLEQAPRLKFAGTATAGSDHIDRNLLNRRNIGFAAAPGCNARAVAEYVAMSVLIWAEKRNKSLSNTTAGIVGVGHTGSEVRFLLERMGIKTCCYDPPRELKESDFTSAQLYETLSCNMITLHIPLTYTGEYATYNWLNDKKIKSSSAQLFINSARGGIADERALLGVRDSRKADFILDVWNHEPVFDDEIANAALLATPHIAGYSKQSKLKATQLVCNELHEFFHLDKPVVDPEHLDVHFIDIPNTLSPEAILDAIHPARRYHKQFKLLSGLPPSEKMIRFARLRTEIPLRDEFEYMRVHQDLITRFSFLEKLGVKCPP